MFTRLFLLDALERAVKTAAQVALVVLGQDVAGVDLFAVDLGSVAGLALGGALVSVLTSIVSAARPGISPASLVHE